MVRLGELAKIIIINQPHFNVLFFKFKPSGQACTTIFHDNTALQRQNAALNLRKMAFKFRQWSPGYVPDTKREYYVCFIE